MIKLFGKTRHEMLKKQNFLRYILYAIGEISLIVIGILLALYLQNRNEEKKVQENVAITLKLLKDEIITNKNSINNVKDYHIMVRDTLKVINMPETEEGISEVLSFWRGMNTPRLQNSAFQTTIQSGIGKEFNPLLLKTLNNLYSTQDAYNDFTSQSSQIFFNADFTDFSSFKKLMASVQMTMTDLFYSERELSTTYEFSLKTIDSIYPSID